MTPKYPECSPCLNAAMDRRCIKNSASTKTSNTTGWVMRLLLIFTIGWTGLLCGCGGSSSTTTKGPTKAEWRAKLAANYGQVAQMGILNNLRPAQFKSVMGEPSKIQTIGDSAYWYYICSDGTIQLELYAPNLAVGVMQGKINDY